MPMADYSTALIFVRQFGLHRKSTLSPFSLVRFVFFSQHRRSNLELQNLISPLIDATDAHVLQMPAGPVEGRPASAAEHLHGPVRRIPGGVGSKELGLGCEQFRL